MGLDKKMSKKKGKNQKVNEKVREMLIKSRAKNNGEKRLREEDRIYLEVIVLLDEEINNFNENDDKSNSSSIFCFFSKMTSIGKVAANSTKNMSTSGSSTTELLVKLDQNKNSEGGNNNSKYCRPSNTMRLYEAQE